MPVPHKRPRSIRPVNPPEEVREVRFNGLEGLMYLSGGQVTDILLFQTEGGRIARMYGIRNPHKLPRAAGG